MSPRVECGWLEALQEAVWLVDPVTLCIVCCNAAAAQLLALDRTQVQDAPVTRFVATPQDHVFWSQPLDALGEGMPAHSSLLRGDGSLVHVDQRTSWQTDLAGQRVLMWSATDRTHQVQVLGQLEASLAELRATLDSAADGLLVTGLGGDIRAFNQRLAQLWDLPQQVLTLRDDASVLAHMRAQVRDVVRYDQRLAALPLNDELTDVLVLKNGLVLERRVVPQMLRGQVMGRVFSFRDITRQAEVQASLRLAARVFDSSLDAIFIADDQLRILRMNPGCERLVGPKAHALVGQRVGALFGVGTEGAWMERVQDGWRSQGYWEGELWLPQEGGSHCAVQLSWVALHDDDGCLIQSVGFMRDLTSQRAAQQRIEELAYSDALTGLPNRLLLSQRVQQVIAAASGPKAEAEFAILFLDLDRFKIINDSLGHPFGDRVLQLVAERLQTCLRQVDMLCRLGGDEFVIYLHGGDAAVASGVARRILDEMLRPFELDAMGFSIQCSMGIALYPHDGANLDELIKQADTAMYRVKDRGRGSFGFYQPQMNANLLSRMQMEHAMRQAMGAERLAVHYQPQVNVATGGIVGAEALIRWNDPEFGQVSPGQFVPLAEESGYIVNLGAWVMEQAIREAARWKDMGFALTVSVNVSALEFRQPDFVERITRLLAVHQLPPTLLELELTESILVQDAQEMELRLKELAALGISLAIDDFGTGYSSLAYLKKLPIHKLKIDQSFVRGLPQDEGDRAIVNAVISLGRSLRMEVMAEGVETATQMAVLRQMDCDYFQGYLCAPGLPAEQFRRLLVRPPQSLANTVGASLPSLWQMPEGEERAA